MGSECIFSCSNGTELVGINRIKCLAGKSAAYWSHVAPRCQKLCMIPDYIENGRVECNQGRSILGLGEKCSFYCNHGFTLVGDSHRTCTKVSE